jgi:hypothetical protein
MLDAIEGVAAADIIGLAIPAADTAASAAWITAWNAAVDTANAVTPLANVNALAAQVAFLGSVVRAARLYEAGDLSESTDADWDALVGD